MRCKDDQKHRAVKHIGRVQRNKHNEIRYFERHAKTSFVKQHVALHCSRCTVTRISGYINNPVFQGLLLEAGTLVWNQMKEHILV